jgi:hypothetical protein
LKQSDRQKNSQILIFSLARPKIQFRPTRAVFAERIFGFTTACCVIIDGERKVVCLHSAAAEIGDVCREAKIMITGACRPEKKRRYVKEFAGRSLVRPFARSLSSSGLEMMEITSAALRVTCPYYTKGEPPFLHRVHIRLAAFI